MRLIFSFLLLRCFLLTLVLGFPPRISTPSKITTTQYKTQSRGNCHHVEEDGYIIEPDAFGRDTVPIVEELQLFPPIFGYSTPTSPPSWCQKSRILHWWCSTGRDDFPSSRPESFIPIENLHNLNETDCFFISGVRSPSLNW